MSLECLAVPRYSSMRPIGVREKVLILFGVALGILMAMMLVNGFLLGPQPGNAANNIMMTGGE